MDTSRAGAVPGGHTPDGGVLAGRESGRRRLVLFENLIHLGTRAGLANPDYQRGVRDGRYEQWVVETERAFKSQGPQGTPAAFLDGQPVELGVLYDPEALDALIRR